MTSAIRIPLLAAVALIGLGLTVPAQAQQDTMSFFVTSVGKSKAQTLVASPARIHTVRHSPKLPVRPKQTGMPI
jgi:hypothetical protein